MRSHDLSEACARNYQRFLDDSVTTIIRAAERGEITFVEAAAAVFPTIFGEDPPPLAVLETIQLIRQRRNGGGK